MPVTYRDLQAPTLLDTTRLETGDSEVAAQLARSLKAFETGLAETAFELRAQQGAQEGAAAGESGDPEFRAGLRAQTAYGRAYNNAALRSYAVRAEGDAEDQAARLEVEAQNDPEKFLATFGAVRDEILKTAPPEARATLSEIYGRRLNTGVARLRQAQAIEINKQARADTAEGVERSIDRIATLYASNDPRDYELALEEEAKLNLLIDGARNDQTISPTEWAALKKSSQRKITQQTVAARFRNELNSPYGNPVDFIERLKKENVTSEALSPTEEAELVDHLVSELQQHNALMSARLSGDNAAVRARYEQGDREATAMLFAGELTTDKLRTMVVQQRLDPGRATSLANELSSGGIAMDDPKEAFHVRTNLLKYSDQEIESNQKLTWKTRGELLLLKREQEASWKGTQAAREADARIERALGILPGTMIQSLSDEQKAALDQAKTEWYNEVDKLPPAERQAAVLTVAEDVIGRFIRKNKSAEAQALREAKARYIAQSEQRFGKPEQLSETARKKYDARLQQFDAQIAAAEAEAARK